MPHYPIERLERKGRTYGSALDALVFGAAEVVKVEHSRAKASRVVLHGAFAFTFLVRFKRSGGAGLRLVGR